MIPEKAVTHHTANIPELVMSCPIPFNNSTFSSYVYKRQSISQYHVVK